MKNIEEKGLEVLEKRKEEAQIMVKRYEDYSITTADDYKKAAQDLKSIKDTIKSINKERKALTKPLDEIKGKIMAKAKKPISLLEKIVAILNQKLASYRNLQEEKAQKAKKELEKQKKDEAETMFMPKEIEPDIPDTEVKVRKNYKFKIVDESKIKSEYMMPDEKKIGKVVRKMKEKATDVIGEGISIYTEETSY